MQIEIILILLSLIAKKCNKYVFLLFILIISYLFLYHKNTYMSIIPLDFYSLINENMLMPEIINKVPF